MAKTTSKKKVTAQPAAADQPATTSAAIVMSGSVTPDQVIIKDSPQPENPVPDPGQEAAPPPAPVKISYEIVEARFKKELTKFNYEVALQGLTSYKVTEDNLGEAQQKITEVRRLVTKMEGVKTGLKATALQTCRWVDNAYNSLKKPLEDELAIKQIALNNVAAEQARKKAEAQREEDRKENIKTAIDNFIIEQSQEIAGCKTNAELVTIQKLIGSHKAAKTRYEEFLPDLIARCEPLNDLIKAQKKTIDDLEKLEKQKLEAEKTGDDATLIALEDKKDDLISEMAERKVVVQETAINQAIKAEPVEDARPHYNTIGARRTVWKAELVKNAAGEPDKKELEKAFKAGLLKCTIDPDKTRTVLDTLKSSGSLKDKTEIIVNGIRYFEEKIY